MHILILHRQAANEQVAEGLSRVSIPKIIGNKSTLALPLTRPEQRLPLAGGDE